MSYPQLVMKNQFGEESINAVLGGNITSSLPVASHTVMSNISGGAAVPIANTYADVVAALPNKIVGANSLLANKTAGSLAMSETTFQALQNALPAKTGVAAINAEAAATAITIALSTGDTYTDAAVNTAVNTALTTVVTDINAAITQINAILAALKVIS